MALPTYWLKRIKIPSGTEYEIIPARLGNGTYDVSLPTLTTNTNIIVSDTSNTQQINSDIRLNNSVIIQKYLQIYSDGINVYNPYGWDDPDVQIYSTYIKLLAGNDDQDEYNYVFPNKEGIFVVREDDTYYDEDLDEDVYSEKTLLAATSLDGSPYGLYAVPNGFDYYYRGSFPALYRTARFAFPKITNANGDRAILGLQVDIVDLRSL